ncbi:MAG: TFIIB-type zinc ribbon-containing protein, partial [Staphylothermus sp.]|nr:TFIIB-type zinc ribbon-containing protein [Staphylothermus sp.]MCD6196598.1 TFIIB-type zinc ribbon-containing protein [Staphylothermus sp.]
MSNQCPVCGGILVWDYQRGEVICSSCGLVVDRIYDYSPLRENEETITWRNIKIRNNPKKNKKLHEYKLHIRLYIKAQSYVKDKPW